MTFSRGIVDRAVRDHFTRQPSPPMDVLLELLVDKFEMRHVRFATELYRTTRVGLTACKVQPPGSLPGKLEPEG